MKCKICGKEATVYLNYPRMRLCKEHFIAYFERKIERTIKKYKMVSPEENILIAFSGGKDSAAVAHVFKKLGYSITGLHINLGIGGLISTLRYYPDGSGFKKNTWKGSWGSQRE